MMACGECEWLELKLEHEAIDDPALVMAVDDEHSELQLLMLEEQVDTLDEVLVRLALRR